MISKRSLSLIFVVICVVSIVFGVILLVSNKISNSNGTSTSVNVAYNTTHQGPDHAGPPMVIIQGQGLVQLNQILLSQQYSAVKSELNTYILTKISPSTVSAVVSNAVVNSDGSVSFMVQTTNPSSQFTVNLDRSQFTTIGFSVPSSGFQQTLNVYGSSTSGSSTTN